MTEIERIIKKGTIKEDFLKEEVRNDFLVTTDRKKLWAVILDLYLKFVTVCEKYGLRFWAEGGTLLGAVRHKGFIPWDDDVDIMMPLPDLLKFKKQLEKILYMLLK